MTRTVLILGAGSTRALGNNKPVAKKPPLDADFFEIARLGKVNELNEVSDVLNELVGEYSTSIKQSLERAATYLYLKAIDSPAGSPYHKGFVSFLRLLQVVLASTTNPLKVGKSSLLYRFLLNELKTAETPDNLSVITFNYDLMVERALDEIASNNGEEIFQLPGCYRLKDITSTTKINGQPQFSNGGNLHEGVEVLKLHGSMNWLSVHTSDEPMPRTLFAPNREIHVADSPNISWNLNWKRNKRKMYMKPIIVPPVSGKRGMMHKGFDRLWDLAGERLRNADRIVVAGYSCPPLDIEARMLLSESLRKNDSKKLYVIDPSAESAAKFVDICGVDHCTIYSSIKAWVDDARKI